MLPQRAPRRLLGAGQACVSSPLVPVRHPFGQLPVERAPNRPMICRTQYRAPWFGLVMSLQRLRRLPLPATLAPSLPNPQQRPVVRGCRPHLGVKPYALLVPETSAKPAAISAITM